MELTLKEKKVLKCILITELSDADEMINLNDDPSDRTELIEFYEVIKNIAQKITN